MQRPSPSTGSVIRAACATRGRGRGRHAGRRVLLRLREARRVQSPRPRPSRRSLHRARSRSASACIRARPSSQTEGYVGDDVHLAARVAATSHGGQIVLSHATAATHRARARRSRGAPTQGHREGGARSSSSARARFPPLKTISNTNLPRPASSFLGREAELSGGAREDRSRSDGSSPSRVPAAPARRGSRSRLPRSLVPSYKAGVFWVGLASLRDAVARDRDDRADARREGRPRRAHLRARDAPPARQPRAGRRVLLPSSRELLQCLSQPHPARHLQRAPAHPGGGRVRRPSACRARSRHCSSASAPSSTRATEIAVLCTRLDALPLAVELAAARTKAMSSRNEILERLAARLDLCKGGRDADPRQADAARDNRVELRPAQARQEQRLFARLSVFARRVHARGRRSSGKGRSGQDCSHSIEKSLLRFTNDAVLDAGDDS